LPRHARPRYEGNVRAERELLLTIGLVVVGCGGATAPTAGSVSPDPVTPGASRHASVAGSRATPMTGGSSDGTTCEQAREQYTEEINVGAGAGADLKAEDFAAVLNNGSYLNPCDVPTASKVQICAAVQNGHAVGVTVLLDPPSPALEICVAGQVRQLAFPANAKMDFVNVNF
jgi:eukaryotic-like serine/threonine-protein kinase